MLAKVAWAMAMVAVVYASSHSEAPGTTRVPAADLTDLYAFQSYETGREDYTVFMMNANPLQAPFGGPNYHALSPDHYYYIHIDNDNDAVEDISFEFMFHQQLGGSNTSRDTVVSTDCDPAVDIQPTFQNNGLTVAVDTEDVFMPLKYGGQVESGSLGNLNFRSFYQVARIDGPITATPTRAYFTREGTSNDQFEQPMDYVGPKTFPDYEAYADDYIYNIDIPSCATAGRMFVGQRKEMFSVNLGAIFDLINMVPVEGVAGAVADDEANNALSGYNIDTFALEIPTTCLLQGGQDTIGVWSTSRVVFHNAGAHDVGVQYARLGQPLVNEVIIGIGDKGVFNAVGPSQDGTVLGGDFVTYVGYPTLPEVINLLFAGALNGGNRISPTNFPRTDLIQTFLFGVQGLNDNGAVCEYLRLNTSWPATAIANQNNLGVIAGDNAGFPNGRRPGDDVVDIALDVMMGALCHLNLNCTAADAPVGNLRFLDGAPQNVNQFSATFPFALTPLPGFVSNVVVPAATTTTTAEESSATSVESFWFTH